MLRFSTVLNTEIGIRGQSPHFSITSCNISHSNENGLDINIDAMDMYYDFGGTNIEHSKGTGLHFSGNGNVSFVNITVQSSKGGIIRQSTNGNTDMSKCTVRHSFTAVDIELSQGFISIDDSNFENNIEGVLFQVADCSYISESAIKLLRNIFVNNTKRTLSIKHENWCGPHLRLTTDIGYNMFENSGGILIANDNIGNVSFHNNIIKHGKKMTETNVCLFDACIVPPQTKIPSYFDISDNIFEENTGICVIYLNCKADYNCNGTFFDNTLLSNRAKDAVIKVNTNWFNMSENIFDNPDSPFDLYVTHKGNKTVHASNNWWGSAQPSVAEHRIFHFRNDKTLLHVNITPILTDEIFDCAAVSNCSGNGECVRPTGCRCFAGWLGVECRDYTCIDNCFNNGVCKGPNQCDCSEGWTGEKCMYPTCNNVNNCSGHGICIRPDACMCVEHFTGNDCLSCTTYYWGPDCKPCPACKHGRCEFETGWYLIFIFF